MRKQKIYISLPKNISFSVFEATKLHGDLFKTASVDVVYLSRNKDVISKDILYFNNAIAVIKFLRKQNDCILYAITVFEVLLGYIGSIFNRKIKVFFWVQGLIDEEDYHSNQSKIRYLIFKRLLKFSIKVSSKIVVVTDYMFKILVSKYGCNPSKEHLLINCKSRVHYNKKKKRPNSLCYIGGLSKWQNVNQALEFFNLLCKESKKYTFYLATFNHNEAKKLIEKNVDEIHKNKIILMSIKETEEVEDFLSEMEFGFLIRDNILLNNVASPIKLAEYLACGINPIMSASLYDYISYVQENNSGIIIAENIKDSITALLNHNHSTENAIKTYNDCFGAIISNQKLVSFLS